MMTKVFGFLVCLMATMGVSQAALLAAYTFSGNKNATDVETSLTGDSFTGPGSVTSNAPTASALNWYEHNTGSTNTPGGNTNIGTIQLTPSIAGYSFNYTRVVVRYRAKGDLGAGNKIFAGINDDTNGIVYFYPTGTANNAGTSPSTNNFYTWDTTLATPIIGDPDSPLSLSIVAAVSSTTPNNPAANRRIQIDSIELYGDIIPEPASMAIFGLLGVGAVAGRFRRKK